MNSLNEKQLEECIKTVALDYSLGKGVVNKLFMLSDLNNDGAVSLNELLPVATAVIMREAEVFKETTARQRRKLDGKRKRAAADYLLRDRTPAEFDQTIRYCPVSPPSPPSPPYPPDPPYPLCLPYSTKSNITIYNYYYYSPSHLCLLYSTNLTTHHHHQAHV